LFGEKVNPKIFIYIWQLDPRRVKILWGTVLFSGHEWHLKFQDCAQKLDPLAKL